MFCIRIKERLRSKQDIKRKRQKVTREEKENKAPGMLYFMQLDR